MPVSPGWYAVAMTVSVETFRRVALEDDEGVWELRCGHLVRKPSMTMEHNQHSSEFLRQLSIRLDPDRYSVRMNAGHMRLGQDRYVVADVIVIPVALLEVRRGQPTTLEEYAEPLPFVVEVWSRSTGDYDVESKLPAYRERGDLEIWRVHPYERTVTAWRRRPDGSYSESHYGDSGRVRVESLGVRIDLARVFRY